MGDPKPIFDVDSPIIISQLQPDDFTGYLRDFNGDNIDDSEGAMLYENPAQLVFTDVNKDGIKVKRTIKTIPEENSHNMHMTSITKTSITKR